MCTDLNIQEKVWLISSPSSGRMSTSLSSSSFHFPSPCSCFCFLTPLRLVCPCPSVLKPSRVLPLIPPSVCDSTFCQLASASIQTCDWHPEEVWIPSWKQRLGSHDLTTCLLMEVVSSFEAERWHCTSTFNTLMNGSMRGFSTHWRGNRHWPHACHRRKDWWNFIPTLRSVFLVSGPSEANRACHSSLTAFCYFIFMSVQSNCWGN